MQQFAVKIPINSDNFPIINFPVSEEAKMLLRSNKTYVIAADDNDSFAMYTIAKAVHTRLTSFAVAQHAFESLFKITMTGTFAAYSDALSNARLTFDAIFDPTATGTMPIDNIFTMMIVNGLPERFRYMKDRLYSQDLNGAFPTYDEVHLAMQTYDLNNRSVEPPSATPSGPTILAATTDVHPICTICRKPFPRVLSKVSGLPFQRCQPCNYKARNPTPAPTVPTPAQVTTAQGQLKKAQAVLLAAKVDYNVTSATEPLIPPPTSRDADSLNRYMQSQNYSLTATTATATSPNYGSPSVVLADMPWLSDSGATYSSTNNLSDLHRPVKLLNPIPITGADGTIIYATNVGSAHFDTTHAIYFVPRSAVKLVSFGALTASGYSNQDRSFVLTRPTGITLCSCPIQPNNTWIFPSHLMTGKILPTTAVPTGISVTPGATVLPFSIPRDGRHFTKEEVKRATLVRELHHFLGHPHDRALKLTLD